VSGTVRFGEIAGAWETDAKFHGEHQRIGPAMELAFALDEARRERAQPAPVRARVTQPPT
jgi:hypothetical protein